MAPHSSTLARKIPWMEEPGRLQSMGSRRVGHDWATSLSLFTFMHRRRKWQPTPVFLPRRIPGTGSLVGCRLSMGSHRVGHDWSDLAAAAKHLPCTPTLLYQANYSFPALVLRFCVCNKPPDDDCCCSNSAHFSATSLWLRLHFK